MTAPTAPVSTTRVALAVLSGAAALVALTACSGDPPVSDPPDAPVNSAPAAPTSTPPTAPSPAPGPGAVSARQAGRLATDRYGGRVLNVEPDTAHGAPAWEVEIADSREGRIEVDIDQRTGATVEIEHD